MDLKAENKYFSHYDVTNFQRQIINKWKPMSDVWALRFGDEILGAISTFGSLYITHFLRKELKIRPYATLTCYMPVIGFSALGVTIFHSNFITRNILNNDTCPTCITTKGGFGQMLSLAYTLSVAPVVCFYVADRLLTYPVPPLYRAPREVFFLYQKILHKYRRPVSLIGAFYMIAGCFITHQKYKNMETLDLKSKM